MDFTFGIITNGGNNEFVRTVLETIKNQNIPIEKYEVIIVGNYIGDVIQNTRVIPFDEGIKHAWITKKKNIITQEAKFENVVYMHDYVSLTPNWYSGFLQYGNDFLACMNVILNADGSRYRDWSLFPMYASVSSRGIYHNVLLPYNVSHLSPHQYFSGAYFVCKKHIMQEIPLNEALSWGEGEDVQWSEQYKSKYPFKMNALSAVKLLKWKDRIFHEITPAELARF